MKKITKALIVLVLAFTAASCSKTEADQSENITSTAKHADKSKTDYIYTYANHGSNPQLTFHFASALEGVKKGDHIVFEIDDNGNTFEVSTTALNDKEFRVAGQRQSYAFSHQIGREDEEKTLTVKQKDGNGEAQFVINGLEFYMKLKS